MKSNEANLLRILYFLVFSCTAAWLPIFADFLQEQGLGGLTSSTIINVTPFMMLLVQPVYGMVADRLGYKKSMRWATLLAGGSYLLYLIGGEFAWFFCITIVMSLFYNTLQPLLDSLSLRLIGSNPGFSYGTLRVAGAAGWSFMGLTAGRFIDKIDTSVIFIFSAVSLLVAFWVTSLLPPDAKKLPKPGMENPYRDLRSVARDRRLLLLLFTVFIVSVGATTIWNFYSIYMKENGASATLVGFGLSFQGLCELPLFYFSARIIAKLGIKTTLVITVFTTALRLLLYALIHDPQAAIAIELMHGISWSLYWVVCVEYVNSLVKEAWRATGQSLLYAAYFGAGAIVGNFWTGYLMDTGMRVSGIFLLNAGIVSGVGTLIWIFLKAKKAQA
jgi:PPP family 3-phenylpropionic acid transporter